jgi:predicted TIM-barrel fold metal-dependent hydrolase
MIIDAHCHIWENWPYQPPVPDHSSRARAEWLLWEMDVAGVERAVVVCAAIGDNPKNVDYAFEAAGAHPGRFLVFPDLECRWSSDYRRPGAARRLQAALSRWDFIGFTHYPDEADDCAWMTSEDGLAFFGLAAERRLLASVSVLPHQVAAVIAVARRFPGLQILLHHFGFLGPRTRATEGAREMVVAAAQCPNVHVKYSGIGNVAAPGQEYPYPDLREIVRDVTVAFGPARLVWGSDYPVSQKYMTYAQTLSFATRHGGFAAGDLDGVLGGNLYDLLASASPGGVA